MYVLRYKRAHGVLFQLIVLKQSNLQQVLEIAARPEACINYYFKSYTTTKHYQSPFCGFVFNSVYANKYYYFQVVHFEADLEENDHL